MKKKSLFLWLLVPAFIFSACSKNDTGLTTNLTLVVKSSFRTPTLKSALLVNNPVADTMVINELLINVKEIEFNYDEKDTENEVHGNDTTYKDNELQGPFLFNLVTNGSVEEQILGTFELPNAAFDKIEFKLDPSVSSDPKINGRSIYVSGTLNGTPFEFWHNTDDDVEIELPDSSGFILSGADMNMYIDFHIEKILQRLQSLNLENIQDGNGNGIFEIAPDDPDGNSHLANQFKEIIMESSDLDNNDSNEDD